MEDGIIGKSYKLKAYPSENYEYALIRERHWIETLNAKLNKILPSRTIKEYCEVNKEKLKEYQNEYREKNKERAKEYQKEYRENNKDKVKVDQKEYRENNKERAQKYREDNKAKIKEYYQLNKDKLKEYQRNKMKNKKIQNTEEK